MAVIFYIFQHFLSVLILDKRFRLIFSVLCFFLFVLVLIFKVDAYDIFSYTNSVSYSYVYEPLYRLLIYFFSNFSSSDRVVIFYFQFFLCGLILSLSFLFKKDRLLVFTVIICSVFFSLAVNNALRQGMASVFLIFSIYFLLKKNYTFFLFFSIFAFFSHKSSFLFTGVIFSLYFSSYIFKKFSFGVIALYLLFSAFSACFFLVLFIDITGYGHYLGKDFTLDNERTPLFAKVIPILFIFFLSELLVKLKKLNNDIDFVRYLRSFFIFFILSCTFFNGLDEIGARILFFYFAVEMFYMMKLIEVKRYQAIFLILISYSFAFNVWNVLGGF